MTILHLLFVIFSTSLVERKKAAVKRSEEQLLKMEVQATDREENKQIALGTSKLNYLDPRISVAWWVNTNMEFLISLVLPKFMHLNVWIHPYATSLKCKIIQNYTVLYPLPSSVQDIVSYV